MNIDLEYIHDLPNVKASNLGEEDLELVIDKKSLKISKEALEAYEDAINPKLPFGRRVKRFLTAQNKSGRIAKTVKDAILIFAPFGKQINTLTDMVSTIVEGTMPEEVKPKYKSKQIIVFSLLLVAILFQKYVADVGLEISPDAEWLGIGTSVVGIVLRLVTNKGVKLGKVLKTVLRQE